MNVTSGYGLGIECAMPREPNENCKKNTLNIYSYNFIGIYVGCSYNNNNKKNFGKINSIFLFDSLCACDRSIYSIEN